MRVKTETEIIEVDEPIVKPAALLKLEEEAEKWLQDSDYIYMRTRVEMLAEFAYHLKLQEIQNGHENVQTL